MQVLRGQKEEHVPTVDVIIDRILTDFRVKMLSVVSDFRKGGTRGKALDHDELLQPLDQGVVMADFELLALFLEESLVFAVCHVRTIDLNVNEVRGALLQCSLEDILPDGETTELLRLYTAEQAG